jgi:COP9 signalosome complex subunit 8
VSSHPLSHALAALLKSTLERKYENTYARAQELFQMSQQSDFPDPTLGKTVGLLVNDFIGMCKFNQSFIVSTLSSDAFRKNTFTLVSRAFACLHITEAQKLLGLGRKEVLTSKFNG